MSEILFPQPEAKALAQDTIYYLAIPHRTAHYWCGSQSERGWLEAGLIYATEAERDQRLAWEAQENAKRIIPQWYRNLGPDVEWFNGISWNPAGNNAGYNSPPDWSKLDRSHYRAKPKQIVRTVDGVEYRWAPTLNEDLMHKTVYFAGLDERFDVLKIENVNGCNRSHATLKDCEQMCAALNAVLGVK